MPKKINIRQAVMQDLPALVALEDQGFNTDLISPRSFRRWLRAGHPGLAVACAGDGLLGYVLILRRRGSKVARLYSIAVSPQAAGQGVGRALLNWAEQQAGRWSVQRVKLEVQADNRPALRLYESAGYRVMAELPAYYENGADGLRMVHEL